MDPEIAAFQPPVGDQDERVALGGTVQRQGQIVLVTALFAGRALDDRGSGRPLPQPATGPAVVRVTATSVATQPVAATPRGGRMSVGVSTASMAGLPSTVGGQPCGKPEPRELVGVERGDLGDPPAGDA